VGGPLTQSLGVFSGAPPSDVERDRVSHVLASVMPHAKASGVAVMLEPLNRFECYMSNTLDQAAAIARTVNHSHVGIMSDTHHAHIEEKSTAAAIARNADMLGHVQFSENDRGTPGSGQIDFEEITEALRETDYDGWISIEAFSWAAPELAQAVHLWREPFASAEQLARDALAYARQLVQEHA